MPSNQRSGILRRLVAACTFPSALELDDPKCHICQETSLCDNGPETPIKLRCKHVFGMACILSHAEASQSPKCPLCRKPIFTYLRARNQFAAADPNKWQERLAQWSPGNAMVTKEREDWIKRANGLWKLLCDNIVCDLESHHETVSEDEISAATESFLNRKTPSAEEILSFDNAYNFYQAYFRQGWGISEHDQNRFGRPLKDLLKHLASVQLNDTDLEAWRIFQAFRGPGSNLAYYGRKMELSRSSLSKAVTKAQQQRRARPSNSH